MTGFVDRLLGRQDPAGSIRPVLPSRYEPPSAGAAPGGLDILEGPDEMTELCDSDWPQDGPAAESRLDPPTATDPPRPRADPGVPPAASSHTPPPLGGFLASPPSRRPASQGKRGEHRPHLPAGSRPETVAVEMGAEGPGQPATGTAETTGNPPSRRPPAISRLRASVEHVTSAPTPATGYPAFPAAGRPPQAAALAPPIAGSASPRIPRSQDRAPHSEPDVRITIGRIEVRAVPEPLPAAPRAERDTAAPTLQDYLRGRDGRT